MLKQRLVVFWKNLTCAHDWDWDEPEYRYKDRVEASGIEFGVRQLSQVGECSKCGLCQLKWLD